MDQKRFAEEIIQFLPTRLRKFFQRLSAEEISQILEIRLRVQQPLHISLAQGDYFLGQRGLTISPQQAEVVLQGDLGQAMLFLSNHSLYALDEELRQGFITIPGGHRVGFVGRGIVKNGSLKQIKDFSALNFRITREINACADPVLPYIIQRDGDIYHTMIISPPRCGKTTLLRDLICKLSNGFAGFSGMKVGVVDERSELAGSFQGVPRHNLGIRTDILDHCPKATGMYLLIRSMSPQVIATDELGSVEDIKAVQEVVNAGIRLITTVHGKDISELMQRPNLKELLTTGIFSRYILLSNRSGAGTIEGIFDRNFDRVPIIKKERRSYA